MIVANENEAPATAVTQEKPTETPGPVEEVKPDADTKPAAETETVTEVKEGTDEEAKEEVKEEVKGEAKEDTKVNEEPSAEKETTSEETPKEEDKTEKEQEAMDTETLTDEQKKTQHDEFLTKGRRAYLTHEYDNAAELFSRAAELAAELWGEFGEEAFDSFLLYGKALLELAGDEQEVISGAMTGIPKDSGDAEEDSAETSTVTDEEMADIRDKVVDALTEERAPEKEKADESEDKKEEKTDAEETAKEAEKKEESTESEEAAEKTETATDAEEADDEQAEEEVEDEEQTPLQLAWEAFECARKVAEKALEKKPDEDEWMFKMADALLFLAQCSITNEQYDSALEDLGRSCDLLERMKETHHRMIVEVFFHSGRASRLGNNFDDAAKWWTKCKETINARIAEVDAKEAATEEEKQEKEDLASTLEGIDMKIEDALASASMYEKAKRSVLEAVGSIVDPNPEKPANDISGLVRKTTKRAADEAPPTEEAKKPKSDEEAQAPAPAE